jgi:AcrR family transcriptional regulator
MLKEKKNQALSRERRRQICRGAMKIFKEKSFHAATMREIAAASGMGLGNLYNYIERKEDILYLIHSEMQDKMERCFQKVLGGYDSPREQLIHIIRELYNLTCLMKEEVLFILTEAKSLEKKDLYAVLERESLAVGAIASVIERGMKEGQFRSGNPVLLANIIAYNIWIVPLRGWNILQYHSREELLREMTEMILCPLGAQEGRHGEEIGGRPQRKKGKKVPEIQPNRGRRG